MNAIKFETTRPWLHFTIDVFGAVADWESRLTGHAWSWEKSGEPITNRLPALGEGIKREEICN